MESSENSEFLENHTELSKITKEENEETDSRYSLKRSSDPTIISFSKKPKIENDFPSSILEVQLHEEKSEMPSVQDDQTMFNFITDPVSTPFCCKLCPEQFRFFYSLACHIRLNHGKASEKVPTKRIKCELCHQKFKTQMAKTDHINSKHSGHKGDFTTRNNFDEYLRNPELILKIIVKENAPLAKGHVAAKTLNREFIDTKQKIQGVDNMLNTENPDAFECGVCQNNKFSKNSLSALTKHVHNSHKKEFSVNCLICNQSQLKTIEELKTHLAEKHSRVYQNYRCLYCQFGTDSTRSLTHHKKVHHLSQAIYKCDYCPTRFFHEQHKNGHILRDHPDSESVCKVCSKVFDKDQMKMHVTKAHLEVDQPEAKGFTMSNDINEEMFVCSLCPDFIATCNVRQFSLHLRLNHSQVESSSQCALCKTTFPSFAQLRKHAKKQHHTMYQPFRCELCRFGTDLKTSLEAHKIQEHPDLFKFTCDLCPSRAFYSQSDLNLHTKRKHIESSRFQFECNHCFKQFTSKSKLNTHINLFHGFGYKCDVCGVNCSNQNDLKKHMKTHEETQDNQELVIKGSSKKEDDLKCRFVDCLVEGANLRELIDHMLAFHHGEEKKCAMCSTVPADRNKLRLHYYGVHLKLKPYVCKKCGISFGKKSGVQRHLKEGVCDKNGLREGETINDWIDTDEVMGKLDIANDTQPTVKEFKPKFYCEPCSQGFRYQWSYDKHIRSVHEGLREHQCADCGKFFQSASVLNKHMKTQHYPVAKCIPCSKCDKQFKSISALHSHLRTVHELFVVWVPQELNQPDPKETIPEDKILPEVQSCPALECDFQTQSLKALKEHQLNEHSGRPYQCEKCGLAFLKQFNLKKHVDSVHLGVRGHMCDKCGQGFYKKSVMVRHQKTSCSGNPQYTNATKNEVGKHKKSFNCSECASSFNHIESLQLHMAKTHLNIPSKFECHHCRKAFVMLSGFKHHLAVYHGETPVGNICEICGVDCESFLNWRYHVNQHYSGGVKMSPTEKQQLNIDNFEETERAVGSIVP